jgi:hypothetical protein
MSMKIVAATAVALSLFAGAASAQTTTHGERQAGAALFDQGGVFDKARNPDIDPTPTASISIKAPANAKSTAVPADNARNEGGQGMDLNR